MIENNKFSSELSYAINNVTSDTNLQDYSEKNTQNSINVNTFNDEQAVNLSIYSPTSSTSSGSSCGSSFNNYKRLSSIELDSILDTTENYELDLRKLDISLETLNWAIKSNLNETCININELLTAILNTNNETSFILFLDSYLECTICKLNIKLNKFIKKIKRIFKKVLSNSSSANNFNLNLLINKSSFSVINLIINHNHDCSKNSNELLLQAVVKKFLKNFSTQLFNKLNPIACSSSTDNNEKSPIKLDILENLDHKLHFDYSMSVLASPLTPSFGLIKNTKHLNVPNGQYNKKLPHKKRFWSPASAPSNVKKTNDSTLRNKDFSSLILKAINERKVLLTCTKCGSKVKNMTDHLLKKHSIHDRDERKTLMKAVKEKFLFTSKKENHDKLESITNCSETKSNGKNLNNEKSQQKEGVQQQQRRKMIKCPLCNDENKYFVNISDHLIKIHHMDTNDKRKPVLKRIKESKSFNLSLNNEHHGNTTYGHVSSNGSDFSFEKNLNQSNHVNSSFDGKKVNKRKLLKTKKIHQKESHSQPTIEITAFNGTSFDDLIKKSLNIDEINQFISENSNHKNNENENTEHFFYDNMDILRELMYGKTTLDASSSHEIRENEAISLIIDLENNINVYNNAENISGKENNHHDQIEEEIIEKSTRVPLENINKTKAIILAPRKREPDTDVELSTLNNEFSIEHGLANNDYTSKKSNQHNFSNFYHSNMSSSSRSESLDSSDRPTTSHNEPNPPNSAIYEINPTHFEHVNDYPQFDELDIENRNEPINSDDLNIIENQHDHENNTTNILNTIEEPIQLFNNNKAHHSKHHLHADGSVRSSCSSQEDNSLTNYNSNQFYYNNNYKSTNNHSENSNSLRIDNMAYTGSLWNRFTEIESNLNSTIRLLTNFTDTIVKQLEMTRSEIKSLKNELITNGICNNNTSSTLNLNTNDNNTTPNSHHANNYSHNNNINSNENNHNIYQQDHYAEYNLDDNAYNYNNNHSNERILE